MNEQNDQPTSEPAQLTDGQKLVGIQFNPSKDERVDRAKKLAAELADIVLNHPLGDKPSYLTNTIKGDALRQVLHAQMAVVKLLTWQHD